MGLCNVYYNIYSVSRVVGQHAVLYRIYFRTWYIVPDTDSCWPDYM